MNTLYFGDNLDVLRKHVMDVIIGCPKMIGSP